MCYCFAIYSYDIKTAWYITAFISCCYIELCNLPYYLLLSVIYSFDCISIFVITSVFDLYKYNIIIFLCDNIYLTCFIAEIPFKNSIPIINKISGSKLFFICAGSSFIKPLFTHFPFNLIAFIYKYKNFCNYGI